MFSIFPKPKFQKVFEFMPGSVGEHWESQRVGTRLQELSDEVDSSIEKVYEARHGMSGLVSGLDHIMWLHSVRQAEGDQARAVEVLSWAQFLAKKAGFKIGDSHRGQARKGVVVMI